MAEGNNSLPNSWGSVRKIRDSLRDCENYPVRSGLEESWQKLRCLYNAGFKEEVIKRDDDEGTGATPLDAFMYYIDAGFYPPPEILMALAAAFQVYFRAGGQTSLEEVFFGKETKWVGNEASRRKQDEAFVKFHFYRQLFMVGCSKQSKPVPSMEKVAEDFFGSPFSSGINTTDLDSFLRNYRRWKKRFIEKNGNATGT